MRLCLHLLLVALFAVLAVGFNGARVDAAMPDVHAVTADEPAIAMAGCEHCGDEDAPSMAAHCASACASPAVALVGDQCFEPAVAPAPRFPPVEASLPGGSLPPEPSPPRTFPS